MNISLQDWIVFIFVGGIVCFFVWCIIAGRRNSRGSSTNTKTGYDDMHKNNHA